MILWFATIALVLKILGYLLPWWFVARAAGSTTDRFFIGIVFGLDCASKVSVSNCTEYSMGNAPVEIESLGKLTFFFCCRKKKGGCSDNWSRFIRLSSSNNLFIQKHIGLFEQFFICLSLISSSMLNGLKKLIKIYFYAFICWFESVDHWFLIKKKSVLRLIYCTFPLTLCQKQRLEIKFQWNLNMMVRWNNKLISSTRTTHFGHFKCNKFGCQNSSPRGVALVVLR